MGTLLFYKVFMIFEFIHKIRVFFMYDLCPQSLLNGATPNVLEAVVRVGKAAQDRGEKLPEAAQVVFDEALDRLSKTSTAVESP